MYRNLFKLGYDKDLYETVLKKCVYGARCESCKYFDEDNLCSNSQVTSFDITKTKDRCYCVFWQPTPYEK